MYHCDINFRFGFKVSQFVSKLVCKFPKKIELYMPNYVFNLRFFRIGEEVKALTKGMVSAYAGPVEKVFSPVHATLSFTNKAEIDESVIKDKVRKQTCYFSRIFRNHFT